MNKEELISIGTLSRVSGVHVQSLRYYEKLGILQPCYTDPASGYRYYSFAQVRIVEAIQYCVDFDIPLSRFSDFISYEDGSIDYSAMVQRGRELADERIRRIQRNLSFMEYLSRQIAHAESIEADKPYLLDIEPRCYWLLPYEGGHRDRNFKSMVLELLRQVQALGVQTSYEFGLLSRWREGQVENFAYVDLIDADERLQHPQLLRIPAGRFLCRKTEESLIRQAPMLFPETFAKAGEVLVIEKDLFTGVYPYEEPLFELRCST